MSEWISVERMFPENNAAVIVYCNASDSSGIAWRAGGKWFMPEPQSIGYDTITHWMPLPAPPSA